MCSLKCPPVCVSSHLYCNFSLIRRLGLNLPQLKLSFLDFTLLPSNLEPGGHQMIGYGPIVFPLTHDIFHLICVCASFTLTQQHPHRLHNNLTAVCISVPRLHVIALVVVEIYSIDFGSVFFSTNL